MTDDARVDLSALDPMEDPARWQAILDDVQRRVDVVLAERSEQARPLIVIASWRRRLMLAAAVVITVLVPAEVALEAREKEQEQVRRLVAVSVLRDDGRPTGAEFLRALGERAQ
jgi:riboflavin biosynthesis pyrimidine reductase